MERIINDYKSYVFHRKFFLSVLIAISLLFLSLVINFYAGIFATERASNSVNDLILNNIRVYDVDVIFIYGPPVLWGFVAILCLIDPKKILFVVKSVALFVLIRSLFIILTHIGPFPGAIPIDLTSVFIKRFTFGGDLFFSAHTGLPFLMALVFWKDHFLRILFVVTSILFGVVVLMGHLHYSIDVLSAFFITYTIYHISCVFFRKDKILFEHGITN